MLLKFFNNTDEEDASFFSATFWVHECVLYIQALRYQVSMKMSDKFDWNISSLDLYFKFEI